MGLGIDTIGEGTRGFGPLGLKGIGIAEPASRRLCGFPAFDVSRRSGAHVPSIHKGPGTISIHGTEQIQIDAMALCRLQ